MKIFNGAVIPSFKKDEELSISKLNLIVMTCNSFLKLKITRGESDKVLIADGNVVIQIRNDPPSSSL